jgi:hypothetical protein
MRLGCGDSNIRSCRRGLEGGESAAGCGSWLKKDGEGVSNAGEPDAAGSDAGGFGGAVEYGSRGARMPTHRIRQRRDECGIRF